MILRLLRFLGLVKEPEKSNYDEEDYHKDDFKAWAPWKW